MPEAQPKKLNGTVEADEAFIGGKKRGGLGRGCYLSKTTKEKIKEMPMTFVKVNEYFINLDQIIYVQDDGQQLVVCFGRGTENPTKIFVQKGTTQASHLIGALNLACI